MSGPDPEVRLALQDRHFICIFYRVIIVVEEPRVTVESGGLLVRASGSKSSLQPQPSLVRWSSETAGWGRGGNLLPLTSAETPYMQSANT